MTRLFLALFLLMAIGCTPTPVSVTRTPTVLVETVTIQPPTLVATTQPSATTYPTLQPTATNWPPTATAIPTRTRMPSSTIYPTAIPSMTPIPTATPPATWTPGASRWLQAFHGDVQGYAAFLELPMPVPLGIVQGIGVIEMTFSMTNRWDQPRVVQWDVYDPDAGVFYAHIWELGPHEGYSAIRIWAACNWDGVAWQWFGHMTGDADIHQPHTGTLFLDGWVHHD